jgi:NAD dependent epimerase/dehydratase family enzyme
MSLLRESIGRPFGIPISELLLKIGAVIIKTESELVLKSRNVIPKRLQQNGFTFKYDTLEKAFDNLLQQ